MHRQEAELSAHRYGCPYFLTGEKLQLTDFHTKQTVPTSPLSSGYPLPLVPSSTRHFLYLFLRKILRPSTEA